MYRDRPVEMSNTRLTWVFAHWRETTHRNSPSWEAMRKNGGYRQSLNMPPADLGSVER